MAQIAASVVLAVAAGVKPLAGQTSLSIYSDGLVVARRTLPQSLAKGRNSFTEGEAKSRIEKAGFSNISELKKDDNGVWRGRASKDGRSVDVSLDYQGNVVTR